MLIKLMNQYNQLSLSLSLMTSTDKCETQGRQFRLLPTFSTTIDRQVGHVEARQEKKKSKPVVIYYSIGGDDDDH